jgi:hypothetical protein
MMMMMIVGERATRKNVARTFLFVFLAGFWTRDGDG